MIESINNEKIKYYSKLKEKKYRDQEGLYLISTPHLVLEALKNNVIEIIYLLKDKENIYGNVTFVTESIMRKLSDLDSIPEVVAVCKKQNPIKIEGNTLILDSIQDPGNLGTILRSAVAFNIKNIIMSKGCVDLYNEKVLRAAEGMHFHLNILTNRNLLEDIKLLKETNYKIIGTKLINGTELNDFNTPNLYALVMGNEGNGISSDVLNLCDDYVFIKMSKACESLNVGVATSIILYKLNQ